MPNLNDEDSDYEDICGTLNTANNIIYKDYDIVQPKNYVIKTKIILYYLVALFLPLVVFIPCIQSLSVGAFEQNFGWKTISNAPKPIQYIVYFSIFLFFTLPVSIVMVSILEFILIIPYYIIFIIYSIIFTWRGFQKLFKCFKKRPIQD